ncbi:MAG: hypothetical protein ABIJ92_01080 [Candidatus Aenigmatarchaeota archaeon]
MGDTGGPESNLYKFRLKIIINPDIVVVPLGARIPLRKALTENYGNERVGFTLMRAPASLHSYNVTINRRSFRDDVDNTSSQIIDTMSDYPIVASVDYRGFELVEEDG